MRVYADLTSGILSKNLPKLPSGLLAGLLEAGVGFLLQGNKAQYRGARAQKVFPAVRSWELHHVMIDVVGIDRRHGETHDARSAYNFIAKFLMR